MTAPASAPHRGPWWYLRLVVSMAAALAVTSLLVGSLADDDQASAEEVCAEHSMVVRSLEYEPKDPVAHAVVCAPPDDLTAESTYDLPGGGGELRVLGWAAAFGVTFGAVWLLLGVPGRLRRRAGRSAT